VVQQFLLEYFHDVSANKPYVCGNVIDFWGGKGAFESLPSFIKDSMVPLVENNVRHWDLCAAMSNKVSDLQSLVVPTQLVCGTYSNSVAHAIVDHLCDELPTSKKYIIEGASHFLVTSHLNECLAVLQSPPPLSEPK
jgi:pimeloyl-ACP methyl ester carboxylesterase